MLALWATTFLGCSGAVKTNPLPGGGYVVSCEKGISSCISRAEVVCADKGYTIVGGMSSSKVLGGPNSPYRKLIYKGELSFYCGQFQAPQCGAGPAGDETEVHQLSAVAEPLPAPVPVPVPAVPQAKVCVPGTTQTCVGPGACAGGQVCMADGMGYGPCDCGPRATPSPAPAALPPSPAASGPAPAGPAAPATP